MYDTFQQLLAPNYPYIKMVHLPFAFRFTLKRDEGPSNGDSWVKR